MEEDGFVLPPLATIVLKALVKTEGRVGVFAPSVGLQLTGQEFDAIESVVLPVLVRRGMQLVPPAIHFSFDDESESAIPIVVSVDLCDNLADGISRIELVGHAKFKIEVTSNNFDRGSGDNLRNHYTVSIAGQSHVEWIGIRIA